MQCYQSYEILETKKPLIEKNDDSGQKAFAARGKSGKLVERRGERKRTGKKDRRLTSWGSTQSKDLEEGRTKEG